MSRENLQKMESERQRKMEKVSENVLNDYILNCLTKKVFFNDLRAFYATIRWSMQLKVIKVKCIHVFDKYV